MKARSMRSPAAILPSLLLLVVGPDHPIVVSAWSAQYRVGHVHFGGRGDSSSSSRPLAASVSSSMDDERGDVDDDDDDDDDIDVDDDDVVTMVDDRDDHTHPSYSSSSSSSYSSSSPSSSADDDDDDEGRRLRSYILRLEAMIYDDDVGSSFDFRQSHDVGGGQGRVVLGDWLDVDDGANAAAACTGEYCGDNDSDQCDIPEEYKRSNARSPKVDVMAFLGIRRAEPVRRYVARDWD